MMRWFIRLLFLFFVLLSVACGRETAVTPPPVQNEAVAMATAVPERLDPTATAVPPTATTISPATGEPSPETAPPATAEPTATPQPPGAQAVPAGPGVPVKIAVLDALQQDDGQERLNWARLAVADFNAATGWDVELVEVDTGLDATTIMAAINSVTSDPAIYTAVGPHRASQIIAAAPMSDMVGLPHLVLNGYPGLAQTGRTNLFRLVPTDDLQGAAAARFIVDTLGAQKVFVIVQAGQGSPGSYGYELYTSFEQALAQAGGAIIARVPVAADATGFSDLAAAIAASGAEAVFGADTSATQGALIAQALQAAGVDIPLVGPYGWADVQFAAVAEGAYVLSPAPVLADPDLAQRYEQQHGPFGVYGPLAYEATMVALETIQRAAESGQLNRAAVAKEIAATNQANGVLARPLAFTGDGNLQDARFYVLQVVNGVFSTVEP